MIMCVLLCYPVSIHMLQLQATGRPISSFCYFVYITCFYRGYVGILSYPVNVSCIDFSIHL